MLKYKKYGRILDNDFAALIPEWWAWETLREMMPKLVVLPMVNRDYNDSFAQAGDVVNLHRIDGFTAKRKFKGEPIVMQAATATYDDIRLNQHIHTSFLLDEVDERSTFPELSAKYIPKAAEALANGIDQVIMGEAYQFHAQAAGKIGLDRKSVV